MKICYYTLIIVLTIVALNVSAQGTDYKYVRTYDANGNVIKEADSRYADFISVSIYGYEFLGNYHKFASTGLWTNMGNGDWKWTPGNSYGYNSTNNGWDIFVLTIAYHSEYLYVRKDLSVVRWTFMAGGNGCYKEYIRQQRPTINRLGPTQ